MYAQKRESDVVEKSSHLHLERLQTDLVFQGSERKIRIV